MNECLVARLLHERIASERKRVSKGRRRVGRVRCDGHEHEGRTTADISRSYNLFHVCRSFFFLCFFLLSVLLFLCLVQNAHFTLLRAVRCGGVAPTPRLTRARSDACADQGKPRWHLFRPARRQLDKIFVADGVAAECSTERTQACAPPWKSGSSRDYVSCS